MAEDVGLGDMALAQGPPLPVGHGVEDLAWQRGQDPAVQRSSRPGKPGLFSLEGAEDTFLPEGLSGERTHRDSAGGRIYF